VGWVTAFGQVNCLTTYPATEANSAFHPSGIGKWVPAIAGKANAGMAHSDCGAKCGCAGKTVRSPENTCHTRALLRWWFTKRRYIRCTYLYLFTFTNTIVSGSQVLWRFAGLWRQDRVTWLPVRHLPTCIRSTLVSMPPILLLLLPLPNRKRHSGLSPKGQSSHVTLSVLSHFRTKIP